MPVRRREARALRAPERRAAREIRSYSVGENRTHVRDVEMTIENDRAAWEHYNAALERLNQASARFRDLRHLPDHHRDRVEALDAVIRVHVALDKAGDEIDPKFHG
jgi:hypothetical protein